MILNKDELYNDLLPRIADVNTNAASGSNPHIAADPITDFDYSIHEENGVLQLKVTGYRRYYGSTKKNFSRDELDDIKFLDYFKSLKFSSDKSDWHSHSFKYEMDPITTDTLDFCTSKMMPNIDRLINNLVSTHQPFRIYTTYNGKDELEKLLRQKGFSYRPRSSEYPHIHESLGILMITTFYSWYRDEGIVFKYDPKRVKSFAKQDKVLKLNSITRVNEAVASYFIDIVNLPFVNDGYLSLPSSDTALDHFGICARNLIFFNQNRELLYNILRVRFPDNELELVQRFDNLIDQVHDILNKDETVGYFKEVQNREIFNDLRREI